MLTELLYNINDWKAKVKQTKNIFNALTANSSSTFHDADGISKSLLSKARKTFYLKDKALAKLYNKLKNKNNLYMDENDNIVASFYTPFIEQQKDIDRSTLCSFKVPFYMLTLPI